MKHSFRKILSDRLVCWHIVLVCALFSAKANATTYVFAGGGYWVDPSLWSPAYPGTTIAAGDEVLINGFCNATAGITTLVNNGVFRIDNGNLLVTGTPFHNFGEVWVQNSGNVSGILTNKSGGSVYIVSGYLQNLVNESGGYCELASGGGLSAFDNSGEINNSGNVFVNGTCKVKSGGIFSNYSNLNINSNSNLEIQAGGVVSNGGQIHGTSGTLTDCLILSGGELNSYGAGPVEDFTFEIKSDFLLLFDITECDVKIFSGYEMTIGGIVTCTVMNNIWENYGALVNDGTIVQTGAFSFSFIRAYGSSSFINNFWCTVGEIRLYENATCVNNWVLYPQRIALEDNASLTNNRDASVSEDMPMSGNSTLDNYATFNVQGADFRHYSGALTNHESGYFSIYADSHWDLNGVVVNHGFIGNEGMVTSNNQIGSTALTNYGTIENGAAGIFQTPRTFTNQTSGMFVNYGTYINTQSFNRVINNGIFNNYEGATFKNESPGGFVNLGGGTFNQYGKFDQRPAAQLFGPLTNGENGLLTTGNIQSENGCPTITNDVICTANGTFRVKVAQPFNGCNQSYHDKFTIDGTLYLDGTLQVMSNQITQNVILTVIEADLIIGTFSNVIWPVIPGMYFEVQYTETQVKVRYSTTALPVELTRFDAKKQGDYVVLAWKTATEAQNKGFAIERATNGLDFVEIAYVKGAGASTVPTVYKYEDKALPVAPVLYYRLRQEDTDGNTTYSSIVTVAGQGIPGAVLSPNPVGDKATLQLALDVETELSLSVCDVQGRLVYALPPVFLPAGEQLIDLPALNLSTGSYFLRISSVSGIQWVRFIIQN